MIDRVTVALSIQQPWCWAILHLGKDVENRGWWSGFRGRILLHAGKAFDYMGYETLKREGHTLPHVDEFPRGFVGEVTVTGCRTVTVAERTGIGGSPWAAGPWCFTLAEPMAFPKPVPGRGTLRFFVVPEEMLREVEAMKMQQGMEIAR